MTKSFKDPQGRWFTIGLFKELSGNKETVLFSIEEARLLFLECDDVTGYAFAVNHLGGWQHWLALHNSPKLVPLIKEWEEELEVRTRSKALKNIAVLANSDKGYQAAKFLADGAWKVKKVGRTTKEAIKREGRIQSKLYDEFKPSIIKLNKS